MKHHRVSEDRSLEGQVRYRVSYLAPGPNLTPKGGPPIDIPVGPCFETEAEAIAWAERLEEEKR